MKKRQMKKSPHFINNTMSLEEVADEEYEVLSKQIYDGVNNPIAGTGTPIKKLHGVVRDITVLSNIGKGSKANGGDGLMGGVEALVKLGRAAGIKEEAEFHRKKQLSKKQEEVVELPFRFIPEK